MGKEGNMKDSAMLASRVLSRISEEATPKAREFVKRATAGFPALYDLVDELYGERKDLLYILEDIYLDVYEAFCTRSAKLRRRDRQAMKEPYWYLGEEQVAAVCYVDLFAGDLSGLLSHIDYLKELGITVLHLMPFFETPVPENDGGYAVSSYRRVAPQLGTMRELSRLADRLHQEGIRLVADFVLNHTSDEHDWAKAAIEGDEYYQGFYYLFDTYEETRVYGDHLRDIFPEVRQGSFTYHEGMDKWVWTTFNSYQWDLNYGNPELFRAMVREMLNLANQGIDVFRFDAIAFTWKEMGTRCESLPKVHSLTKAFRAVAALAAPGVNFLSEAIVHPDEVLSYILPDECELSYNPLLMATGWAALAARDPSLLRISAERHSRLPAGCAWFNYVRCHDDIGWTFDDGDAWQLGIDPEGHRKFLNQFYTGRFPGSFARGLPFQENPKTGDCRISGTCASLAGLEKGLENGDEQEIEYAIRKIALLYLLAATFGGIPLVYLSDEIGTCNDYSFLEDGDKSSDSRWVHRSAFDWQRAEKRDVTGTVEQRVHRELKRAFSIRQSSKAFGAHSYASFIPCISSHLLAYRREYMGKTAIVVLNFSDSAQLFEPQEPLEEYRELDRLTGQKVCMPVRLGPWEYRVFTWGED